MYFVRIFQRRLPSSCFNTSVCQTQAKIFYSSYEKTELPNIVLLGGGLGKMQGGIKEEEYFSTVNHSQMCKIRDLNQSSQMENANSLQNWDEFQKTLDNAALYNTACMNKHKNCMEEAFFMDESTECVKLLYGRISSNKNARDPYIKGASSATIDDGHY